MWLLKKEKDKDERFKIWEMRLTALEELFGKSATEVYHAPIPFELGGSADVVIFPDWVSSGEAYVTAELTGCDTGQICNSMGTYEFMICGKTPPRNDRFPALIANLARYSCEAQLDVGHTMDIGNYFEDSSLTALLYINPLEHPTTFELKGQRHGVLLAIGITTSELRFIQESDSYKPLIIALKERGVFPFTIPSRPSVICA